MQPAAIITDVRHSALSYPSRSAFQVSSATINPALIHSNETADSISPCPSPTPSSSPSPSASPSRNARRSRKRGPAASDPNYVPRPANAFILYACELRKKYIGKNNRDISKLAGQLWANLGDEEKDEWRREASLVKERHKHEHPNYQFKPKSKKRSSRDVTPSTTPSTTPNVTPNVTPSTTPSSLPFADLPDVRTPPRKKTPPPMYLPSAFVTPHRGLSLDNSSSPHSPQTPDLLLSTFGSPESSDFVRALPFDSFTCGY